MSPEQSRPQQILVVDDDALMRETMRRYLCAAGMEVRTADGAGAMHKLLEEECFDLITLDVLMPGEDGLVACRRIRRSGNRTPIIMVTGRSDDADRIVGLEVGADDYLSKPMNLRELQARIGAVLRRSKFAAPAAPSSHGQAMLVFGRFTLNLPARLLLRDGVPVKLTLGEFALLEALADHPRQVMTRDHLAELVQRRVHRALDRSLDMQVASLRKLIETEAASPKHIQTVWGKGYVFVPEA